MEFSRPEYWSGWLFHSPGEPRSPALQVDSLPAELLGKILGQVQSVQLLSHARLFATPWTAARQASLSITNSRAYSNSCPCIIAVMPSTHLILYCPLLLPPSIFPSIRVFSVESVLCIRWPNYWSFSFSISPSDE